MRSQDKVNTNNNISFKKEQDLKIYNTINI